jgi:peptidoglycan/LPS O-acetylase OafA/YrhL
MQLNSGKQNSSAMSAWLDWIRALAAISVFTGHLRAFSLEIDVSQHGLANLGMKSFYFATSLAHYAVLVFFVLSGFLVGGSVLNEFRQTGGLRVKAYVVARVARIHSVLIPALALGAVADWLGLRVFHGSAVYEFGHFSHLLWWNAAANQGIGIFFANVACLQTIFKPVLGSNGPLWSLANEFWYYFLFPALLMAVWPRIPWFRRCLAAVLAMVLLWMLGAQRDFFFLFWLAGVGVRLAPEVRTPPIWLALAVLAGSLVAAKTSEILRLEMMSPIRDAVVAVTFSVLLWSLTKRAAPMSSWPAKCGQQLAASSYTLYACHFPLAVLMATVLMQVPGWRLPGRIHDPQSWAAYAALLLVVGGVCFGLSLVTERKHHQLKRWLMRFV